MKVFVDESLPPAVAERLRDSGHEAVHVYEAGLNSRPDDVIFDEAQRRNAILITRDLDFSDAGKYPPGSHCGIAIVRLHNDIRATALVDAALDLLYRVPEDDLRGNIVILEPTRFRIHRGRE